MRWASIALLLTVLGGCSSIQRPNDGTLDMEKFQAIVDAAERSGATVELDVQLRPGDAEVVNGVRWNTGIELTGRFRWTGKGRDYEAPLVDTNGQ